VKLEPTTAALRVYVPRKPRKHEKSKAYCPERPILVFDTETTEDERQSLLFGSCGVWVAGYLHRLVLFYVSGLDKCEIDVLTEFTKTKTMGATKIEVMAVEEFISSVFFPWILKSQALCVGFNLAFDLSRLAVKYAYGRGKWRNGFTFWLTKDPNYPRVRIRSLDSVRSFFSLAPTNYTGDVRGHFLDLRALGFALTDEKLALDRACLLFDTSHKKSKTEGHGKITSTYVEYNLNDTLATYDLYGKMIERLNEFKLDLPPEKAFSPASLGKAYLRKMGVQPFLEVNPEFPPEILGYAMTTYYGGRSEVRIRKKPTKVRLMDFKSMYPTIFSLMGLWKFIIADKIEWQGSTEETRRLISKIQLNDLTNPSLYPGLVTIVQILPDRDILPLRTHYGEDKEAYNIGVNYVTSKTPQWYTLPEVIGSKLLTGKAARIIQALTFKPVGIQQNLRTVEIPGGLVGQPQENLIKSLIEHRKKKQNERDETTDEREHQRLDVVQNQLKILANTLSYGIFIEMNTDNKSSAVHAYGLDAFNPHVEKTEEFGEFFNPIIATMTTSVARLMLAMAEAWLERHGGYYAFCDTDSMAVSPFHWNPLQAFFQSLNPYDSSDPILKLEHGERDANGNLRELWFYGISAKRYVLYRMKNNKPAPVEHGWSSHGLGHLLHQSRDDEETPANWERELWTKIIKTTNGQLSEKELYEEYSAEYAVSKYAVTTPILHRRLKAINRNKSHAKQIKPFNFILVGQPTETNERGKPIHPITKFTQRIEQAPFQPFVDYNSARRYSGGNQLYWKTLESVIHDYLNHPESKFANGDSSGKMRRRHLLVDRAAYIGKETSELEETELLGLKEDTYVEILTVSVTSTKFGLLHDMRLLMRPFGLHAPFLQRSFSLWI
jgi:hypothetical protein